MKLQAYLMQQLKDVDCLAWSNNATGYGMRGIPDVTVICHNHIFYVECKDERTKDRLTELQKHRIKQIEDYGHTVYICRTMEDARSIAALVNKHNTMLELKKK